MPPQNATGIDKVNRSRIAAVRLFIAAEVPEEAKQKLGDRLKMFQEYVRYMVPVENCHVTFLFLGAASDWAFAKLTALLETIKQQLIDRTERCYPGFIKSNHQADFAPHIKLANLRDRSVSALLADSPLIISWPIKRLILFRSKVYFGEPKYEAIGTTSL